MAYNETRSEPDQTWEISNDMEALAVDERNKSNGVYTTSVGSLIWYTYQLAMVHVEKSISVESSQWIDFMQQLCPC